MSEQRKVDAIIADFFGLRSIIYRDGKQISNEAPYYHNPAAGSGLIPALKSKGYHSELTTNESGYQFKFWHRDPEISLKIVTGEWRNEVHEAIISAIVLHIRPGAE